MNLYLETQDNSLGLCVFPKSGLKRSEGRNLSGREMKKVPQGGSAGKGTWKPPLLHPLSPLLPVGESPEASALAPGGCACVGSGSEA